MVRIPWLCAAPFLTGLMACGTNSAPRSAAPAHPNPRCATVPVLEGDDRLAVILVNGRKIAEGVPVHREGGAWEIQGPEPEPLAAIDVNRIDLVEFASGAEAEQRHDLCPGEVAMLLTLKSDQRQTG